VGILEDAMSAVDGVTEGIKEGTAIALRKHALDKALCIHSTGDPANNVVNTAKQFEAYLKGESA
jgi:hypothetical protein